MIVKFKKLHPDAVIPTRGTDSSAGLDITAIYVIQTPEYIEYKTGLAFEIPEGYAGLLFPRSSISKKTLTLTNSVGILDSDFRGEISFRFKVTSANATDANLYQIGDRIGQLVIMPYPKVELQEVQKLNTTERGSGGFGSTGA